MNRGYSPEEIVEKVKLPKRLADHPHLYELYGRVDWSVKSTFAGYMGWFDGDVARLSSISPKERAEKIIKLAGGIEVLIDSASQAMKKGELRWALELVSHAHKISSDNEDVKGMKRDIVGCRVGPSRVEFTQIESAPSSQHRLDTGSKVNEFTDTFYLRFLSQNIPTPTKCL